MGVAPLGTGGSIALTRGNYQVAMRFDVPRAQVIEWTLQCPSVERTGVAGETYENYRTRRLAELRRMVEEDRRRLATVTNVITGGAGAAVQLEGPGTNVRAEARAPSGEVVADQAIQPIHELPYGDVGAGTYMATINVQTLQDGACTVTTKALDPIGGTIAVDRVRDLEAEKQERLAAQRTNAIDARMRVRARLVAFGADELARERRIAEQARLREEERQRRLAIEARHAAEREARQQAERIARAKRDEETRLRLEAEARIKWEAEAPERARRARLEAERLAALEVIENERRAREAKEEEARRARMVIVENERRAREANEEEARRARMVIVEKERLERIRIIEEERRLRVLIIERERTESLRVRGEYIAWLVACGADPHRRARVEQERIARERRIEIEIVERSRRIEIERIERERRVEIERSERQRRIDLERAERQRRIDLENERVARERRQREQRDLEIAIAARTQLAGYLVTAGARLRPPRPSMLVEAAGSAPFDGARWEAGTWIWVQAEWQWQWRKGGWVDSMQFGAAGGETVVRAPAPVREVEPVRTTTTTSTSTTPTTTETVISVPAGITIGVPQGSITIGVQPAPPRVKSSTRRRPKADVRDHRR